MKTKDFIRKLIILAVMCAVLLATACSNAGTDGKGTAPLSDIKGFYAHDQIYFGGSKIDLINIKGLSVGGNGDNAEIAFSFVQGSAAKEMVESEVSGVPEFSVRVLPKPYRLVISLSGISFYDYDMLEVDSGSQLISAHFVEKTGDGEAMFIFHLDANVVFQVNESAGMLKLTLRRNEGQDAGSWHAAFNAVTEFVDRPETAEIGLWPSLCADGQNKVLLSPPFESEERAAAFLTENAAFIDEKLPGKVPYMMWLEQAALPEYDSHNDYAEAQDRKVILKDGQELSLPVLQMNAQLLCYSEDGKTAAYSVTEQTAGGLADRLFIRRGGGELEPLAEEPFVELLDAVFSPDGQFLAVREQAEDMSPLYVVALDTGELYSAAEEGLGITTWGYAWDDDSTTLYAMAGESVLEAGTVTYQLKSYTVDAPRDRRVSALEEYPGTDGEVGFAAGYVYFADPYSDSIKRISKEGGPREQVATGQVFRMSPDAKRLASLGGISREGSSTFLDLYDVDTGDATQIVKSEMILSALFSSTGKYLIYSFDTGESSEYPVEVHAYSVANGSDTHLFNMRYSASLKRGRTDGELVLVSTYLSGQDYIPVNYVFTLN